MKRAKTPRAIPAVEKVLQALGEPLLPRPLVVAVVRDRLAFWRKSPQPVPPFTDLLEDIRAALRHLQRARLRPVINATGVLVHTNLGRAPLSAAAVQALTEAAAGYTNLEYDLNRGERGGRAAYLEELLARLCQAEAATAVNNCAAALVLIVRHFLRPPRQEVLISRGELIQIGGGFRIPEILEASGARLREVGTTNRTSLNDYARAIGPQTALILRVHRSNFFMDGFVESPDRAALAELAKRKRLPFVEDLGSGAVVGTESLGIPEHEPTPAEVLRQGADLVCFSGDKLLGGPQAGIIAGRQRLVAGLKREPFFRALRCDKLVFAALQATAEAYLQDHALESVPVLRMAQLKASELEQRAKSVAEALAGLPIEVRIGRAESCFGGGTLPRSRMPSVTVDLKPRSGRVAELAERLRRGEPPVVGYVAGGWLKLDLRTVLPGQERALVCAIRAAAG